MASWPQKKSNCLIGIGIFSSFMASRNTKVDPSDAQSRLSEELSNPIWNFEYQNCFTMNNALPWKKLWLNDYIICYIPNDSVLWWGRVSSLSISTPHCQKQSCKKCQTSYSDRVRSSDNTAGTMFIVYIAVWERRSSTSKLWNHIKLWVDWVFGILFYI